MTLTPDKPETRRDKELARRRRMILDAAMMCFLENGYHQTGVRDIARRAGISLGNLYNHFPGKHDVLAEIAALERAEIEPFLKLLAKPSPAVKTLDRFITKYAKYVAAPENVILSLEITSEAIRKPDIAKMFLANREALVNALTLLIKRGIAESKFQPVPDPYETSHLIIELIEGSAYRSVLGGSSIQKNLGGLKNFIFAVVRI